MRQTLAPEPLNGNPSRGFISELRSSGCESTRSLLSLSRCCLRLRRNGYRAGSVKEHGVDTLHGEKMEQISRLSRNLIIP